LAKLTGVDATDAARIPQAVRFNLPELQVHVDLLAKYMMIPADFKLATSSTRPRSERNDQQRALATLGPEVYLSSAATRAYATARSTRYFFDMVSLTP
jgi:hypothetical protein